MPDYYVLIPAGGSGTRTGYGVPKQYIFLNGLPLLNYALNLFNDFEKIAHVFVVVAPDDIAWQNLPPLPKVSFLTCGGNTRAQSVANGLAVIGTQASADDWIIVHDAARPCLKLSHLQRLIKELEEDPVGGLLAIPIADTLKLSDAQARVITTAARKNLWAAQTPQMFRFGLLQAALKASEGIVTDEAQAVECLGHAPKLIAGDPSNIKITFPADLELAQAILSNMPTTKLRIGQGFDVHALVENRRCIIGGVDIPFHLGLAGHSDADVLLHAICDSLLGAAGLGDIGQHFPDTDVRYKNINSRALLTAVGALLLANSRAIINIDATIIAQAPKIAPHIAAMINNIAADLNLQTSQISIKATTTEFLGFTGRGEGIAASAIALVE